MRTNRVGMRLRAGLLTATATLAAACGVSIPTAPPANNGAGTSNASNVSHSGNANANTNANSNTVAVVLPAPSTDAEPGLRALVFTRPAAPQPVNYLLFVPEGSPPAGGRWPAIFYLHGKSLSGDDPWMLTKYGVPRIVSRDRSFPFVVVAPQCRAGERWTDVDTLSALLDDVLARYPVDPTRVYLTGFSMGAGGAWRLGGARPERFAAVAALAGVEETGSVKGLARVPVWAFHGVDDEEIPATASEAMVAALQAAGGDARLELIPGRGHDITTVYDREDLYAWFLEHRRG